LKNWREKNRSAILNSICIFLKMEYHKKRIQKTGGRPMTNEENGYHRFGDINVYTLYQRVYKGITEDRISDEVCRKIPLEKDPYDGMKKNAVILNGSSAGSLTKCRYDDLVKIVTETTKQEKITCLECEKPAEWVRYTQFSGNHPYCKSCAEKEKDFPDGDGSYSYWDLLSGKEKV